jgi:predicted extracellular nuclease
MMLAVLGPAQTAGAVGIIRITEWMYNGDEFVELTNVGDASVDFTGWSFDDNSRTAGSFSLAGLGNVAAGQSVILSEVAAATFRANWSLALSVSVVGGNTHNLGRADEINIYDDADQLVDRLTYDDQTIGGPRTLDVSGNIAFANLGFC